MDKLLYMFREGRAAMRELLGGKGANLGEMTQLGLPVPPGFTITTDACRFYAKHRRLPDGLMDQVRVAMADLERDLGRRFGDPARPLLVSVRSGAAISMPGMMDTVLNLGLNPDTMRGLIADSGDARFAWDANRRFLTMFGDVVLGIPKARFDKIFNDEKAALEIKLDMHLPAATLEAVCRDYVALIERESGQPFPTEPWRQLEVAIIAVFESWNNERARVYRKKERISDDMGTAVNVQAMVFGNLGADCGTGVAFTRDPATGENKMYGEYLMNAQGEEVVAGLRTPVPIAALAQDAPEIYQEFLDIAGRLERHFRDMMDIEFTIERKRLFILQCRSGKRTGTAAVRMAVEMVGEGLISKDDAIMRVKPDAIDQLLHPRIDEDALKKAGLKPLATGLAASPGAGVGRIVFDADQAVAKVALGEPVILVREETNPDDVKGMLLSRGVLTAHGGKTSHAAVVARGFGIPCVAGAEALVVDPHAGTLTIHGNVLKAGDWLTIDGTAGTVYGERLKLTEAKVSGHFAELMGWCDARKRLGVRTNADNPTDTRHAVELGAEGIGLCRTEHMFFERDRLPIVRQMILAQDEHEREVALDKLQVVQQADFERIFEELGGRPVTIRLIDPPLHEFLPRYEELIRQVTELRLATNVLRGHALEGVLEERQAMLKAVEGMREQNPMLGLRGVRLSIIFPGLVQMQTRAILNAAIRAKKHGHDVEPEIMIPLVGHENELAVVREQLDRVARELLDDAGVEIRYTFGTMIELPRAALTAGPIARHASFFSFGTNDLTQTTFGVSRDDAEEKFLRRYVELGILPFNPFETIDREGVGRLIAIAVKEGREARPDLKCGICGEHGGDPKSIELCHEVGLDYVSCSPYRVPIARLAAAQAAIKVDARAAEARGERAATRSGE
ncbi:MAG: pyruvate, phosphate dikinase [Deltaproteobacteria bacterium]|nr:pyruvate, phosphate dikinase [Deltaproteobacteria bacterium]